MVGPDYQSPGASSPDGWDSLPTGDSAGISSRPVAGRPNIAAWWDQFDDPLLTSLITRARVANLTLAQAEARIREARAATDIAASGLYPSIDGNASATRARTPGAFADRPASTNSLFVAGFDATWEIDVFGGTRRGVEAANAQVQSTVFDRDTLLVSLCGEVAADYFDLRGAQRQLDIARRNLTAQQQTLDLTQERFDAGFVSALDVANAKAQTTATASQIPAFEAQARSAIYAISLLLGQEPAALVAELAPEAPLPNPPGTIPVGLPSDLLRRRPDIRRADADLHAATALVGVAQADFYPKFSLTGTFGTQGDTVVSLGTLANRFWAIGPAVSIPIFQGGRLTGTLERQKAVADETLIAYKSTVLGALRDVETALVNFTREQERRNLLVESVQANTQAVTLSLELYSAGKTDFLNVLTAQRQLYLTEAALAASETAVASDLVALYKALGGGWDEASTGGVGGPTGAAAVP